jgi:hypothetical protein
MAVVHSLGDWFYHRECWQLLGDVRKRFFPGRLPGFFDPVFPQRLIRKRADPFEVIQLVLDCWRRR